MIRTVIDRGRVAVGGVVVVQKARARTEAFVSMVKFLRLLEHK